MSSSQQDESGRAVILIDFLSFSSGEVETISSLKYGVVIIGTKQCRNMVFIVVVIFCGSKGSWSCISLRLIGAVYLTICEYRVNKIIDNPSTEERDLLIVDSTSKRLD